MISVSTRSNFAEMRSLKAKIKSVEFNCIFIKLSNTFYLTMRKPLMFLSPTDVFVGNETHIDISYT